MLKFDDLAGKPQGHVFVVYQRLMLVDNGDTFALHGLMQRHDLSPMPIAYNIYKYDLIYCTCNKKVSLVIYTKTSTTSHSPDSLFQGMENITNI